MGIRVTCPKCNKRLNVKGFLAGKRGVCPDCRAKFDIPEMTEPDARPEADEAELPMLAVPPDVALGPDSLVPPMANSYPAAALPDQAVSPGCDAAPPAPLSALVVPPADVFAQAPQAFWHLCSAAGERQGPMPGEVLRQFVNERRILPDTLVWRDGWTDWQRADVVFAELNVPQAIVHEAPIATTSGVSLETGEPLLSEPVRAAARRTSGHRPKNTQVLVAIVLILCLLALAPVLGYVLMRQL